MPEPVSLLMREFLTWVSGRRRTYAEAMEAWRSTCPRQSVWEDALVGGLIQVESGGPLHQPVVTLTSHGREVLSLATEQSLGT
jgi:hypothetical protein